MISRVPGPVLARNMLLKVEELLRGLSPKGKRAWRLLLVLLVYLAAKALAWLIPLPGPALFRPSATLVYDRQGRLLHAFLAADGRWRINTPLREISPHLQRAVLGYEDRWFYWHPGVNPLALLRALIQNARAGRIVSGGSTITMQIARMMEPKPRTPAAKIREILRAFQLELRYSKRKLLEIYFNIAPYGGNIEGAAAAAWIYFGKEASQLSLGEAALLAALPNSPTMARPDRNPAQAKAARDRVLRRLLARRIITKKEFTEASSEEIPEGRHPLPRLAPHFCVDLHLDRPGVPRLYTTLDLRLQAMAEDLLRLHLRDLRKEGITNGAIVILENETRAILALVGSGDFHDAAHAGQVNGARALRSPGSALKPFIYALALEKGLITPAHYVEDVPMDFSGYAPENYDRTYSGIVSARAALERSLNLPAIALEQALGKEGLYELLRRAGIRGLRPRHSYGLAIAIGGVEITLEDLTALYAMLADGGRYARPRQLLDEPVAAGIRLLDPGTAYIITDILTGLRRPDLPTCWEFSSLPRVAWKTGTSYGHRDAWSIGYNPRYTVGVWLGNFSGHGARNLIGAEVAAPILFELMNSLCRGKQIPWFTRPDTVGVRKVCALSGQSPGPYCEELVEELYLPDRSPVTVCRLHKAVEIDAATGYRLPPHYAGGRKTRRLVYIDWPPRVASWYASLGLSTDRLPPLSPVCQDPIPGAPPVIRSPSRDCTYRLREGIAPEYQKICLEASSGNEVRKLYWFLDGILVATVKPGERAFILPIVGKHRLICQDDLGRTAEMALVVEE
ncbi:MAG: penicillin-binding protein 1C [Firmicutes bacterium]|nr:penicillin-binding protein 1C [Bacillota bacterium]